MAGKDEIIQYIKKELDKGFKANDIKKALLESGHKPELIDKAFKEVPSEREIIPTKPTKILNYILIFIVILIVIIAGYFGIVELTKREPVPTPTETTKERLWEELNAYTDSSKDNYYVDIAVEFALERNDPSVCEVLRTEDLRDDCYWSIVDENVNDHAICNKMKNKKIKVSCYEQINENLNNLESCELLDGREKDACYFSDELRNEMKIESDCEIFSPYLGELCKVFVSGDPNNCAQISDSNVRIFCRAFFLQDSSQCEDIEEDVYFINRDFCYMTFKECDKIKDAKLKEDCY